MAGRDEKEWMRRIVTGGLVVRLWIVRDERVDWFEADRVAAMCTNHAEELAARRELDENEIADELLALNDRLNAVEVVNFSSGKGALAYRDWP